ncbi:DUF1345 domain-containing protein [Caenimonas aquaedulcis]|uniref:DUF1345 domain-containing protein n=1 Tax=Caenimonas aquaedulcis TaxID=2793270 RepID=A0A931MIZ8_9BURK|nr:DUF1345 domain-containing protein [Caenimonas aquaedulcis]MBG9390557.1 DUF1345 domain-containing protein [Caenimonas aquaedulcis]
MSSFFRRLRHKGLHRPRLLAAAALGVLAFFLLPGAWSFTSRVLVAWNIGVWPYLATMAWLMLHCTAEGVRGIAKQEDASSVGLMLLMSIAAILSLAAIMVELAHGRDNGEQPVFVYSITVLTVVGSWLLLGALYTFHYAHLYYSSPSHRLPLAFPDALKTPSYQDFMYFAFTIAAAVQTADVAVHTTRMRMTVLGQSVLSFFFNLAILGFLINIAASMAGGGK